LDRPLNILIAALGSDGDVHPFIRMAIQLRSRGHDVRLFAPAMYQSLAESLEIAFVPMGTREQFDRVTANPDLWRATRAFGVAARAAAEFLEPVYRAIAEHHQPGRTVLVMSTLVLGGRVAQEKLKIPAAMVHLSPAVFRSAIAPARTPPLPVAAWLPPWLNRAIYAVVDRMVIDPATTGPLNALRATLGLPPVTGIFRDWIHSPDLTIGLFPAWFAPAAPDWPRHTLLTGFPLYDEADVTPIDPQLGRFLDEVPAPIAFTPGSAMRHAAGFFAAAMDVCDRLNARGIFVTRHAANVPDGLPGKFHHVAFAPFSRLLPRCAALVHHGGIGTSAQGLAAGIPQLVMPMAHDQFDNAHRLQRLGVAAVLPAGRFTARRAVAKLRQLLGAPDVARACVGMKARMKEQNPFEKTVQAIEKLGDRIPG
jgi:UDP:flavonoid glycosyltransferase YjiC (YdhE family)